jgi:sugar phosphate isomerase/epimerase
MKNQSQREYQFLAKSYKGMFPFKICTTSFIYPDHYIPNVKMLGPFMDEIELLLFESQGVDAVPSKAVIADLDQLGREFNLSYNVHLPTDISLTDPNSAKQKKAVETMVRVIERVQPLGPSALVLHLPYEDAACEQNTMVWQHRAYKNLRKILPAVEDRRLIAIESLDYPMAQLEDIIDDLDLSICLDLGHLMVYDHDVLKLYNQYASNTSVLHLHGVEKGRDHMTLACLSDKLMKPVLQVLNKFSGIVSLEVFSFENLDTSLKFLEHHWKHF